MSDTSQGPGWWQASDGKWYPPEQAPGAAPTAPPSGGYGGAQQQSGSPQPGGYGQPAGYDQPGGYGQPAGYGYGAAGGNYAEWITRVLAYLVDWVIAAIPMILGAILASTGKGLLVVIGVLLYLVGFVAALYFAFLTGKTGQSPGKRVMGIKVVNEATGQPIGGGMGIARAFIHIIDGIPCYLGYLWPLWDDKKQTFTDKVLSTVVLDGQPKQSFGPDLFK